MDLNLKSVADKIEEHLGRGFTKKNIPFQVSNDNGSICVIVDKSKASVTKGIMKNKILQNVKVKDDKSSSENKDVFFPTSVSFIEKPEGDNLVKLVATVQVEIYSDWFTDRKDNMHFIFTEGKGYNAYPLKINAASYDPSRRGVKQVNNPRNRAKED